MQINKDTPLEEALKSFGITFEELVLNHHKLRTNETTHPILADDLYLEDAIDKYFMDIKLAKSPLTFYTYQGVLNSFKGFMRKRLKSIDKPIPLSSIKRTDIELYLAELESNRLGNNKISPYTYNKNLAILSSFFKRYLVEDQGLLPKSPTEGVRRMKEGQSTPRFLSIAEQKAILLEAKSSRERTGRERDFFILFLALNSGLRLQEIVSLNVGDLDFRNSCIYVRNGKGNKPGIVPITNEVVQAMRGYLKKYRFKAFQNPSEDEPLFVGIKGEQFNKRLSKHAVEKMTISIFRKCGIEEGAFHRIRHTYAVNALNSGLSIVDIMTILRHESINTTIKYLRLDDKQIQAKMKENFPFAFLTVDGILKSQSAGDNIECL